MHGAAPVMPSRHTRCYQYQIYIIDNLPRQYQLQMGKQSCSYSTDGSFKYIRCILRIKWEQNSRVQIQSTQRTLAFLNLTTIIFSTSLTVFFSQRSLVPAGLISQVGTSPHLTQVLQFSFSSDLFFYCYFYFFLSSPPTAEVFESLHINLLTSSSIYSMPHKTSQ